MRRLGLSMLVALVCVGCGVHEEGITVTVRLTVAPLAGAQLDTASLAIEQLELVPCHTVRWWQRLSPVSTAWAHGAGHKPSPRVLLAPTLIDLTSAEPQVVGTFHPTPGAYCALEVQFAPSSLDAPAKGATLLLQGTWNGATLRQLSTRKVTSSVPLEHEELDASRLTLDLPLTISAAAPTDSPDATLDAVLASLRR